MRPRRVIANADFAAATRDVCANGPFDDQPANFPRIVGNCLVMTPERRFVQREVRADDPQLSPEANAVLTRELREAVGDDRVTVPAERADQLGRLGQRTRPTFAAALGSNRVLIAITFAVLLIVGVIVALATGSWWAVVAAAAVHALGTVTIISMTLALSTEVEHAAPDAAARLEAEGVADPDRALSELVEQYSEERQARGAAEVVSSGHNRVTVEPGDDPRKAAVEQRTAITPAGSPVEPSSHRGAPMILPILAVAGSVIVGVGAAIALGGIAWLAAAMLVASSLAWLYLQLRMDGSGETEDEAAGGPERGIGDSRQGRRTRLLPTVAIVVGGVTAGVILVGAMAGYL